MTFSKSKILMSVLLLGLSTLANAKEPYPNYKNYLRELMEHNKVSELEQLLSVQPLTQLSQTERENFAIHAITTGNPDMLRAVLKNGGILPDFVKTRIAGKTPIEEFFKKQSPGIQQVFQEHLKAQEWRQVLNEPRRLGQIEKFLESSEKTVKRPRGKRGILSTATTVLVGAGMGYLSASPAESSRLDKAAASRQMATDRADDEIALYEDNRVPTAGSLADPNHP